MPPSDSTPPTDPPDATQQEFGSQDADTSTPEADEEVAFEAWERIDADPSIFSRILISIIAVSHAQSGASLPIEQYIQSLRPEARRAFSGRAQQLLELYEQRSREAIRQEQLESRWMEAAAWGVRVHLDDFARAQSRSFQDLSETVRDRTSWRAQVGIAFFVTFLVAAAVGMARVAVTAYDDILGHDAHATTTQSAPGIAQNQNDKVKN